MGMISGFGRALRMVADTFDSGSRDPSDPRWWDAGFSGGMSLAGVVVDDPRVSQLGSVQAVRHGLTQAMKSLPFSVYRKGAKGARTALPDHAVTRLIGARPNGRNTPAELIGELAWHLSYNRNAFCAIGAGEDPSAADYGVGSLEILHYRRLSLVERRYDGRIYYTFNPPSTIVQGAQLSPVTYREDQLWHLRSNPLREDGLLGEPIWRTARDVFARAIAVHEYGDIWFLNNGQSGGTLEHPGNFRSKDDERDFLESWRSAGTGRNRHRDRLLKYGVKYNPIKVTNAEAQLLETEDAADTAVFGLWNYPPHRASRLKRATNNNIEQQSLEFVVGCLAPLAIDIEQSIERDLLLDDENGNLFCEFNFAGLLRGDLLNRYRAYLIGRQGEWLSANDILRMENQSPRTDEGGDDYKNPLTKDSGAADTGAGQDGGGDSSAPEKDAGNGED